MQFEKYHETGPQTNHTTSYDGNNLLPSKEQRFPVFGCLFTVRATVGGWVSLFRDFVHEIRKKNCESPQLLRDAQSGRDLTFSLLRSPQTVSGNADETAKTILQTPSKLRKKNTKTIEKGKKRRDFGQWGRIKFFHFLPAAYKPKSFQFFFSFCFRFIVETFTSGGGDQVNFTVKWLNHKGFPSAKKQS